MLENYNLTYAMAKEKYKSDLGTNEEIKNKLKEKRKVIQELGPININAVEEYRQIGDRYDVMTTQYNDIKNNAYLNCYIDTNRVDSQTEKFNSLNFADKKKFLIELLDKNQLYVNLMDIDDKEFNISDNDKKFTKSFYKKGN